MTRRLALAALAACLLGADVAPGGAAPEPFRPIGRAPQGQPSLRVYVVRHGQAWKNVPRALRPPGMSHEKLDTLTEEGHGQAEAAGRRLAGAGVTRVLSSPAQRARQTAEAVAHVLGIGPIEVDGAFRPLEHGTSRQAADYRWRTGNWKTGEDPRPEGGESLGDGLARAAGLLESIATSAPGTTLVVVTHGEIAAAVLSKAAGVSPLAGYDENFVGEGTISDVGVDADRWELLAKGVRP